MQTRGGVVDRNVSRARPALRIGISSCLLGQEVRFDGGHKCDRFITQTLGQFCEFVPVCPEVEVGMGVPRESVRLIGSSGAPRMVGVKSGTDWTDRMVEYARNRVAELESEPLHGYILKKRSPSCGMDGVRVYGEKGMPNRNGRGLFAGALVNCYPLLPVEEEERLQDMPIRDNFIERVFAYYRWMELLRSSPAPRDLVAFHTRHKCALVAHSPEEYRQLGRLVATVGKAVRRQLLDEYGSLFMSALKRMATHRKHANVLYHLLGFLKRSIDADDKAELVGCIESYRRLTLPLIVPVTLLLHHFRKYPVDWVMEQTYLNPYPAELMLRNHV
ncbi:MAG: hypothetical protein AUJ92_21970 [Armatimonadetes bacterium CG2_30_59_28]|nr:DUF1722 domain-containing protein [Armatimonadota bacterium]OIO89269.1 MAG: hypothetical protein AUJ92_21970 [Armatimonadetes bacterium CG2_30_59_28]PIU66215.1 MAG: DUF1722 domain-containing protein [Armatimonadetes bacterium CG07_land_8_20_14_0_80_59_28]PIX42087.1 MAG: DUF1722 domain-containing protein [Armatimonadetes bacterium CG_4_8_14_3_um_filter_58_9]PIY48546.1 MAG: DUF1722 domain-containing protein [Armatimonadetes bacterium CG_4_10_14_3_um_filter_59_10]PJB66417.1 MAG: DUF1722 domain